MDIIFSANIVLPLFSVIAAGYLLTRIKLLDADFLVKANNICFRVLLPILVFNTLYKTDISATQNSPLIVFAVLSVFVLIGLLMLLIPALIKDNSRRGVTIQALCCANILMLGIPICQEIYGADGAGLAAMVYMFIIPVLNIAPIVIMNIYDKENATSARDLAKNVLSNPIMVACLLGLAALAIGLKLPFILEKSVSNLASIATPFTLLVLGGTLKLNNIKKNFKILTLTTLSKIFFIPLIMLALAAALGFRGAELCVLLGLFASPTATYTFTLACQFHGDGELAGQVVVTTTVFSVLTLFLLIFIGKVLLFI